jgi:hypothetical protein
VSIVTWGRYRTVTAGIAIHETAAPRTWRRGPYSTAFLARGAGCCATAVLSFLTTHPLAAVTAPLDGSIPSDTLLVRPWSATTVRLA